MDSDLYLSHLTLIEDALSKYGEGERAYVLHEILKIHRGPEPARVHLGKASTMRIHVARKGNEKHEKSFDKFLNHYLAEPTLARVDIEFGPSPDGYTYRYGYTKDLSKVE